jgi:hypothetical protein
MHLKAISRVAVFVVGACLLSCQAGATTARASDATAPRFSNPRAFRKFVAEGRDSPFGLDYVFVHSPGARDRELVDGFCKDVGVRWVNLTRLEWKLVERRAPRGGRHVYNWRDMDLAVQAWQRNGVHIMVSTRFESPWATADRSDREFVYLKGLTKQIALRGGDYLPKPEHFRDLRSYMQKLVERYDGDGRDDMPGLLFPVLHYQIGNEYYNELFWTGNAEEYGRLLRETARAARAASPDVKIILSGIGFKDVPGFYAVGMRPRTKAHVREYLPKIPPGMRRFVERSEEFSVASAKFTDAYDILDARWPNYGIVTKSRELLRGLRADKKPVWSAEIYSGFPLMEPLVLPNWTLQGWPTPSRSGEYRKILTKKNDPQFPAVNAWYRGLQAAQVVKQCMVALDAGSQKLMMGWAIDAQHPLAVSTLSHHGLYSITFKHLWPAAHTYNLTIQKLDGLERIQRLRTAADIYVYECLVKDGKRVLVAFHDDHIGQNRDQPTGEVAAAIPVQGKRARVTSIITEIGRTDPRIQEVDVVGGVLRMKLTEYPVFIEVTGGQQ